MSKLSGQLKDYVTVSMAVELLGHGREQTGRFYDLTRRRGLVSYKLGGMTLAKLEDLVKVAGLPKDTKTTWPDELGGIQMDLLCSRNEAASILGVSPRTVNRYARIGELGMIDLSPWGGHTMFMPDKKGEASKPKYLKLDDITIEAKLNGKQLVVTISHPLGKSLFAQEGVGYRPSSVFFYSHTIEPANIIVKVR